MLKDDLMPPASVIQKAQLQTFIDKDGNIVEQPATGPDSVSGMY